MAEQQKGEVQVAKTGEVQKAPSRMMRPFEEMDRLFDEFFSRGWLRPFRWERLSDLSLPFEGRIPKLDVIDRDDEIVVRAEVPGVAKENIEVSVTGNTFTIKGQTKREEKEEKGDYHRSEVMQGSFSRTVTLPADVNEAAAKAQLKDGVLEVTLPKAEKSKKRSITIE